MLTVDKRLITKVIVIRKIEAFHWKIKAARLICERRLEAESHADQTKGHEALKKVRK